MSAAGPCWRLSDTLNKSVCTIDLIVATARRQNIRGEAPPLRRVELEGRSLVVARSIPDCCEDQFRLVLTQLACQQAVEQRTAASDEVFGKVLNGQEAKRNPRKHCLSWTLDQESAQAPLRPLGSVKLWRFLLRWSLLTQLNGGLASKIEGMTGVGEVKGVIHYCCRLSSGLYTLKAEDLIFLAE